MFQLLYPLVFFRYLSFQVTFWEFQTEQRLMFYNLPQGKSFTKHFLWDVNRARQGFCSGSECSIHELFKNVTYIYTHTHREWVYAKVFKSTDEIAQIHSFMSPFKPHKFQMSWKQIKSEKVTIPVQKRMSFFTSFWFIYFQFPCLLAIKRMKTNIFTSKNKFEQVSVKIVLLFFF